MENQVTVVVAADGRILHKEQNGVFRRSNKYNKLVALLDFPSSNVVKVNFLRSDGVKPKSQYMTYTGEQEYEGVAYSAYEYTLSDFQLNVTGLLVVSLNIQDGNTLATSGDFTIDVEASEASNDDVAPTDPNQYDQALESLMQTDAKLLDRTVNVPNLVWKIQKVAPNAITYTDNSGVISAPIVIEGGESAPIPVNAAGVVKIPKAAWEPVYGSDGTTVTGYKYTVTSGLHGQMRDGATANDLWVSFDEAQTSAFRGAYEDYTVDASGDITISVSAPVDMTVRVWNGKAIRNVQCKDIIRGIGSPGKYTSEPFPLLADEFTRTPIPNDVFDAMYIDMNSGIVYQCTFIVKEIDTEFTPLRAWVNTLYYIEVEYFVESETKRAKAAEENLQKQITANDGEIAELQDEKLSKSGDTMTGDLEVENEAGAKVSVSNTEKQLSMVVPQENAMYFELKDKQSGTVDGRMYFPNLQGKYETMATEGETKRQVAVETQRATTAENHLQEQIDEFTSGTVTSVNGQTGAVQVTPANIGAATSSEVQDAQNTADSALTKANNALPLSGGTLTGELGVPAIFSSANENSGEVVPLSMSFYTNPGGDPTQSAIEILTRIKATFNTNRERKTFFGKVNNSWVGTYMANVYNDSDTSQTLPQYSSGILIIRGVNGQDTYHQAYLIGTENYSVVCKQLAQLDYVFSPNNPPIEYLNLLNLRNAQGQHNVTLDSIAIGDTRIGIVLSGVYEYYNKYQVKFPSGGSYDGVYFSEQNKDYAVKKGTAGGNIFFTTGSDSSGANGNYIGFFIYSRTA